MRQNRNAYSQQETVLEVESLEMSRHRTRRGSKVENAIGYMVSVFLFLPGVVLVLGVLSRMPLGLLGGLLTLYYIVTFAVVVIGGLNWVARALE